MLTPLCNGTYTVKDFFSFECEIQNFRNDNHVMTRFNILSLFTSIPVEVTYKITVYKIFGENFTEYNGFTRRLFKRLYDLWCRDNSVSFYNTLNKKVNMAPMGGCVSPSLAEFFMGHNESIWIGNCPLEFKPVLYKRYVDDTFL